MKQRRMITSAITTLLIIVSAVWVGVLSQGQLPSEGTNNPSPTQEAPTDTYVAPVGPSEPVVSGVSSEALTTLETLAVKGRAPKTGYERSQFGDGWQRYLGCDMRNTILSRDLDDVETNSVCHVVRGTLHDPYTGETIQFVRGSTTSQLVQIDHVVALSDAWQTGAQQQTKEQRTAFANDPLNLLAVGGAVNQKKSDSNAASWLPPQTSFRCQYVARQIAVKKKYDLWVVPPEKAAMQRVLATCPDQRLPVVE